MFESCGSMGWGVAISSVGYQYHAQQINEANTVFLVYGAEAVLPSDIIHASPRVAAYVEVENEKTRQDAVDLLEEERERVLERSAIYQQDLRRYHARRVRTRTFHVAYLHLEKWQGTCV